MYILWHQWSQLKINDRKKTGNYAVSQILKNTLLYNPSIKEASIFKYIELNENVNLK